MCGVTVTVVTPCCVVVLVTVVTSQRMAESSTAMLMVIQQLGSTCMLAVCILCSTRRLIMLTLEEGKGSLAHCQWPFPIATVRLIVIIFRLNVTGEDFVLVHNAVDVSQF